MYLNGHRRSCSPQGTCHCGMRSQLGQPVEQFLQGAERAQPAAIGAAAPEDQRGRHRRTTG